jgi:hypothetical protein
MAKGRFITLEHDVEDELENRVIRWETGTIVKVLDEKDLGDGAILWLVRPKYHRDKIAVWIPRSKFD